MARTGPTPTRWLTGRARPPLWFRLLAVVALTAAAAGVGLERGVVVGVIAGVVYGSIALVTFVAWQRTTAWSQQHPVLDSLFTVPLVFLAIAYLTDLSTGGCVAATAVAGVLLAGPPVVRRRWRSSRT